MKLKNLFHGTSESYIFRSQLWLRDLRNPPFHGFDRYTTKPEVAYAYACKYARDFNSGRAIIQLSRLNFSEEFFKNRCDKQINDNEAVLLGVSLGEGNDGLGNYNVHIDAKKISQGLDERIGMIRIYNETEMDRFIKKFRIN